MTFFQLMGCVAQQIALVVQIQISTSVVTIAEVMITLSVDNNWPSSIDEKPSCNINEISSSTVADKEF